MKLFEKTDYLASARAIVDSIKNGLGEQALEQAKLLAQDIEEDL